MTTEEKKAYKRQWYLNHKEELRKYWQEHKEKHNEAARKWNKIHKDKHLEATRKWAEEHSIQKRSSRKIKYCSEDLSKIENYDEAIKDDLKGWQIHHRLETRGFGYTKQELIALDLYYNRPALELIFLKQSDHRKLHDTFESQRIS